MIEKPTFDLSSFNYEATTDMLPRENSTRGGLITDRIKNSIPQIDMQADLDLEIMDFGSVSLDSFSHVLTNTKKDASDHNSDIESESGSGSEDDFFTT
jgi:hypothetical protein